MSADEVLLTWATLMISDGSTSKLKAREPEAVAMGRPLMVTATNSGPKPRTAIWLDSPPLRFTETPGTRWGASASFGSGNLPASSAEIESTTLTESCLIACARCSAASWPVTATAPNSVTFLSSPWSSAALAGFAGLAGGVDDCAPAGAVSEADAGAGADCAKPGAPEPTIQATPVATSDRRTAA